MPRLAWLATGAAAAALVLPIVVPASIPATFGLVASAVGMGVVGGCRLFLGPALRRSGLALALGVVAIGWRLALSGTAPPDGADRTARRQPRSREGARQRRRRQGLQAFPWGARHI